MLAHKNIVIPSLYSTLSEEFSFNNTMDSYTLRTLHRDWDGLGEYFLQRVKNVALDLTGKNRLKQNEEQLTEEQVEEIEEGEKMAM